MTDTVPSSRNAWRRPDRYAPRRSTGTAPSSTTVVGPAATAHGAVDGALQIAPERDDARAGSGAVDREDGGHAGNLGRANQVARGLHLLDRAGVLDEQHGVGAGGDVARGGAADDGAGVDDLDRRGRRWQHREVGVADRVERVEADDRPGAQVGHRIELDLDLEHQRQRALRAAEKPREVRPVARQRRQVVAVDAPQDARPALLDLADERVVDGARGGERARRGRRRRSRPPRSRCRPRAGRAGG